MAAAAPAPSTAGAATSAGAPAARKAGERRLGVTVKDVGADLFIKEYAAHLKKAGKLRLPKWLDYVKTSVAKELSPYDPDWLYVRAASVARKLYIRSGTGVGAFKRVYGSKKRNGTCPPHFQRASGAIIRYVLKELERIKVVEKDPAGGRRITQVGQRDLDRIAGSVASKHPVLKTAA